MENFVSVFNVIAPTLTAIIVVIFTYLFSIRHKKYEQKEIQYQKTRVAVSNLLLVWKELSRIRTLISNIKPGDELISKFPFLLKRYFKINTKKIVEIRDAYSDSLLNFKETNVSQFLKLETSLDSFNNVMDEFLIPLSEDLEISLTQKSSAFLPLINESIIDFESIVLEASEKLPFYEKRQIKKIFTDESAALVKDEITIPEFVLNMINDSLPLKEEITANEIKQFYENETVIWLISKFLTPSLVKEVFGRGIFDSLKTLFIVGKVNPETIVKDNPKYSDIGKSLIQDVSITEEEDKRFVNNKVFYSIILGVAKKVAGNPPFAIKRALVGLNNGTYSIRSEIEKEKKQLQ